MIIFIGGNGRMGKTLLAQRLMERYAIPYLSQDHLKMGLYRSQPNCGYTPLDAPRQIGMHLWPIIREMVKTQIENRQHMIYEGCYVLPADLQQLPAEYARHVVCVYLTYSDRYIVRHYEDQIQYHRNAIEDRGEPDDEDVTTYMANNARYRDWCIEAGHGYFEIDVDYEETIEEVIAYVDREQRRVAHPAHI